MSIAYACSLFGYNRQVYYRSKNRFSIKRQRAESVLSLVNSIRCKMPRLGGKKLYHILESDLKKLGVGRDKLFDILRANHLLIKPKRQYYVTTNSHHRFRKHKNLIENMKPSKPEQIWVSDITYIGSRDCPIYLALVTDSYSKKIVGYDVSDSLCAKGAARALYMAIEKRQYMDRKLIHHSDRGLQYCSDEYQKILHLHKVQCSMTEKYDPYQNAVAERINGILKQEFILDNKIDNLDIMKNLISDSIRIYNNERPHLSCNMNTPKFMHSQSDIEIKTYETKSSRDSSFSTA